MQEETYKMFELMDSHSKDPIIKVIGVGGGGGNAVQHMVSAGIEGVEYICLNTDVQALKKMDMRTTMQIGASITKGLGAGADPGIGRQAALEDRERIQEAIEGSNMLFVTAGMGGGTGTGAAPVIAQIAKEMGILTVAVVTKPFGFERSKRMAQADTGIKELASVVDSLITIPNDKLMPVLGKQTSLLEVFEKANDVLRGAVQGIAELITCPGLINVDFADVRTVMSEMGMAMMGTGSAIGDDRAKEAAQAAISSPLLEDINIAGAQGILVNVTAGLDLAIGELDDVGTAITELASPDANVVVGTVIDSNMTDGELRVTMVATGLGKDKLLADVPLAAIQPESNGEVDYKKLDRPTAIRKKIVGDSVEMPEDKDSMDYLEIPAFLRRQAD
ncbi:MAG: cell division protein FtsZ [Gammaproteobacteria bacterium]|nr:cell division protein FtsZ [Gammaproteobacteria bacterium]